MERSQDLIDQWTQLHDERMELARLERAHFERACEGDANSLAELIRCRAGLSRCRRSVNMLIDSLIERDTSRLPASLEQTALELEHQIEQDETLVALMRDNFKDAVEGDHDAIETLLEVRAAARGAYMRTVTLIEAIARLHDPEPADLRPRVTQQQPQPRKNQ